MIARRSFWLLLDGDKFDRRGRLRFYPQPFDEFRTCLAFSPGRRKRREIDPEINAGWQRRCCWLKCQTVLLVRW
jgi:hypothetical protein